MPQKKVFNISLSNQIYDSSAIDDALRNHPGVEEVRTIQWQNYRFEFGVDGLRKEVLRIADEFKPDVIFAHIQNSEIFDIETWKSLSEKGFVINYTFDVRSQKESEWLYEVAKYVGLSVFACYEDVLECSNRGIRNTMFSNSSCDMNLYAPDKNVASLKSFAFDIVFCGNRYDNSNLNFPQAEKRQQMISFLEEKYGNRFMCYGIGQKGGMIYPKVEARIYNVSRICISQNNFFNIGYTSDRLWRIMASGAFCLSEEYPLIRDTFIGGMHLDYWKNHEELEFKINSYLSDEKERMAVAECGSKYVRENHTWNDRISEIFKRI